jgi:hypothetical protein
MQESSASEQPIRFDTRAGFEAQWRACLAGARSHLDLFDPDFAVFTLGVRDVDASLRDFLRRGGELRLAMHSAAHIERHAPRFLRLLRDYGHLATCRMTPKGLRMLTDSFCIADDLHIVRRFHHVQMRGEACAAAGTIALARHRFDAIWEESILILQSTKSS